MPKEISARRQNPGIKSECTAVQGRYIPQSQQEIHAWQQLLVIGKIVGGEKGFWNILHGKELCDFFQQCIVISDCRVAVRKLHLTPTAGKISGGFANTCEPALELFSCFSSVHRKEPSSCA